MKKLQRKLPLVGIAILAMVALIGGTFAYFSQTSSVDNYLTARDYDSTLQETFTPPEDGNFTPGVTVPKDVSVYNSGDVGMLVRITYEEYWDSVLNAGLVLDEYDASGYYNGDADPSSYVMKTAGSFLDDPDWVYGDDGWYYYMAELAPGETTTSFITEIMLKASSLTTTTEYVLRWWDGTAVAEAAPETFATQGELDTRIAEIGALVDGSYVISVVTNENSLLDQTGDYQLTITAETVQAVSDAAAVWEAESLNATVDAFLAGIN